MKGLMEESLLRWTWNGEEQEPFLCSPEDGEALLRGVLLTQCGADGARIAGRDGDVWRVETEGGPATRAGLAERLDRTAPVSSGKASSSASAARSVSGNPYAFATAPG